MLTPEQHERRKSGIGSSEAAAAIGLNPYQTSVELWMHKRGELPPFEGNEATKWGLLLEPAVRQEAAEQTGRVIRLPPQTLVHPTLPFLTCHPDGVSGEGKDLRLYEGKTSRFGDDWGEPGTDQIPERYLLQVQHALLVTAIPVADVAVLIGGQDFRLYEVPADAELQATMVEAEREFWEHVQKNIRPQLDYRSAGAISVLKKLYPGTNGQTVQADDLLEKHWRPKLEKAKAAGKIAEAEEKEAKAALLDYMGEAAVLRFADGRALRRARVDRKAYSVEATSYIDARWIAAK
jgi:putative phage-type endonuclease